MMMRRRKRSTRTRRMFAPPRDAKQDDKSPSESRQYENGTRTAGEVRAGNEQRATIWHLSSSQMGRPLRGG